MPVKVGQNSRGKQSGQSNKNSKMASSTATTTTESNNESGGGSKSPEKAQSTSQSPDISPDSNANTNANANANMKRGGKSGRGRKKHKSHKKPNKSTNNTNTTSNGSHSTNTNSNVNNSSNKQKMDTNGHYTNGNYSASAAAAAAAAYRERSQQAQQFGNSKFHTGYKMFAGAGNGNGDGNVNKHQKEQPQTQQASNETGTNKDETNNNNNNNNNESQSENNESGQIDEKVEAQRYKQLLLTKTFQKRAQYLRMAKDYMNQGNYESARAYFEYVLGDVFKELTPFNDELEIRSQLIICRLQTENSEKNLINGLLDCDMILDKVPDSVHHHICKAEINARLCRFEESGECVIKAAEMDQPDIIPSVHEYFHQLRENTKPFDLNCDTYSFDIPVEKDILQKFFNSLSVKCQQSLFLLNWKQMHDAIDSPLCLDMMPKQLTKDEKLNLQKFLHTALDWNLPRNVGKYRTDIGFNKEIVDKQLTDLKTEQEYVEYQNNMMQNSLLFLRVEFANALARTLWEKFPMPPKPSLNSNKNNENDGASESKTDTILSIEDAIPSDADMTYFLKMGLFGCRDGYSLMSAAVFENSPSLTQALFELTDKNESSDLMINNNWLFPAGFRLMYWLAKTCPNYQECFLSNEILKLQDEFTKQEELEKKTKSKDNNSNTNDNNSNNNNKKDERLKPKKNYGLCATLNEWNEFLETRIHAHFAIDPEINETVLTKDAQEDGKKFEKEMKKLIGKEKKNKLMQLELDMSIPILKKYADIMHDISGIDKDVLLYELTLPEDLEEEKEKKRKDRIKKAEKKAAKLKAKQEKLKNSKNKNENEKMTSKSGDMTVEITTNSGDNDKDSDDDDNDVTSAAAGQNENNENEIDDSESDSDSDDDDVNGHRVGTMTLSLLKDHLLKPVNKDYKPIGLPMVVENATFNVIPSVKQEELLKKQQSRSNNNDNNDSDSPKVYDRVRVLKELTQLEKEVIQFQIDYKKQVFLEAGKEGSNQISEAMKTLQFRGLELTKWLRNFVRYMVARRDIEQEIVDTSGKETHTEAMEWFESMTNYLSGATQLILRLIARCFISNVLNAYKEYKFPYSKEKNPKFVELNKLIEEFRFDKQKLEFGLAKERQIMSKYMNKKKRYSNLLEQLKDSNFDENAAKSMLEQLKQEKKQQTENAKKDDTTATKEDNSKDKENEKGKENETAPTTESKTEEKKEESDELTAAPAAPVDATTNEVSGKEDDSFEKEIEKSRNEIANVNDKYGLPKAEFNLGNKRLERITDRNIELHTLVQFYYVISDTWHGNDIRDFTQNIKDHKNGNKTTKNEIKQLKNQCKKLYLSKFGINYKNAMKKRAKQNNNNDNSEDSKATTTSASTTEENNNNTENDILDTLDMIVSDVSDSESESEENDESNNNNKENKETKNGKSNNKGKKKDSKKGSENSSNEDKTKDEPIGRLETISNVNEIDGIFRKCVLRSENVCKFIKLVKEGLGMQSIRIPIYEINASLSVLNQSNQQYWMNHQIVKNIRQNVQIFIEQCRPVRDIPICIVYSSADKKLEIHATLMSQPNKFYACQGCDKVFASMICRNCSVSHYCSRECQVKHWKIHHTECRHISQNVRASTTIVL